MYLAVIMLTFFFYWGQNVHSIYIWTRWLANPQGSVSQRHRCIKISRLWLHRLRSLPAFCMRFINNLWFVKCYSSLKVFHSDAEQREFLILSCDRCSDCGCVWLIVWHPVTWSSETTVSVKPSSDWHFCAIVVLRWMLTNSGFQCVEI